MRTEGFWSLSVFNPSEDLWLSWSLGPEYPHSSWCAYLDFGWHDILCSSNPLAFVQHGQLLPMEYSTPSTSLEQSNLSVPSSEAILSMFRELRSEVRLSFVPGLLCRALVRVQDPRVAAKSVWSAGVSEIVLRPAKCHLCLTRRSSGGLARRAGRG